MFRKISLNAPWVDHYKKVYQLLSPDPELTVSKDLKEVTEGCYNFYIISANGEKLDALRKVLRTNITFNTVILRMTFIHTDIGELEANDGPVIPTEEDWEKAFTGNPLFCRIVKAGKGLFDMGYAVFAHEIIDYFSDDLSDINGYSHLLPATIVKEVCRFVEGGADLMPCTDMPINPEPEEKK